MCLLFLLDRRMQSNMRMGKYCIPNKIHSLLTGCYRIVVEALRISRYNIYMG